MQFAVYWSGEILKRFTQLAICVGTISNIRVEKENEKILELKSAVYKEVKSKYNLNQLKDNSVIRAYRKFYWELGIDPTKTRPSGEALLRRVLHGNSLPAISTAVDAYNLASMKTLIPISGFDAEKLVPPFNVRFAERSEEFHGIGTEKPSALDEKMLVLADAKRILSIYPHRDADFTKITEKTENVVLVGYGALGIAEQQLQDAVFTALTYIKMVSGGEIGMIKVFSSAYT